MKKIYLVLAIYFMVSFKLKAQNEMVKVASVNSVETTVEKLTAVLKSKGLTVFSVVNHKKGAESVAMELRPTTVVIFGNPSVGTKLMNCDQRVGADLPMKILVWQDEEGNNWVGYWKPSLLATRYNLDSCLPILEKMDGALAKFSSLASH